MPCVSPAEWEILGSGPRMTTSENRGRAPDLRCQPNRQPRRRPRRSRVGPVSSPVPSEAEENPPSTSVTRSSVGRSPRGRVSSASRIFARCSGIVPQQRR